MIRLESLPDDAWFEMLSKTFHSSNIDGIEFPGWPPASIQEEVHGASGKQALLAAFNFYKQLKSYADFCEMPFHRDRKILDFGCGYGRITRLFMKDFFQKNIYGMEPFSQRTQMARKLNPYVTFIESNYTPPSLVRSSFLDYIYAFSIFTHVSEDLFLGWFKEFHRILNSGGIVVFTIMPPDLFNYIEKLREKDSEGKPSNEDSLVLKSIHNTMANTFADMDIARSLFANDQFVFDGQISISNRLSRYGWSVFSKKYIQKSLDGMFNIVDFNLTPEGIDQIVVCVQKI